MKEDEKAFRFLKVLAREQAARTEGERQKAMDEMEAKRIGEKIVEEQRTTIVDKGDPNERKKYDLEQMYDKFEWQFDMDRFAKERAAYLVKQAEEDLEDGTYFQNRYMKEFADFDDNEIGKFLSERANNMSGCTGTVSHVFGIL